MRQSIQTVLLTMLLLSFFSFGQAQEQAVSQHIYFRSGRYNLSVSQEKQLAAVNYKSAKGNFIIVVSGRTDNKGDYNKNKALSKKRADAVKQFLIKQGIDPYDIVTKGFGPDSPLASNSTSAGRRFNRSVVIETETLNVKVDKLVYTPVSDISDLYAKIRIPLQSFCINRNKDTVIRCKKGTVIYIKANSLLPASPCGDACVTFRVKEIFLKSDMILDNITTTSNGEMIESQGMIYTEAADCYGKRVELRPGKDLVIMIPADTIRAEAKIFDGNRVHDSIMNWTLNNNSILSNFSLPELDLCSNWLNCKGLILDCEPCRFFFCRVKRIGKAVKGTFSKPQHFSNKEFRQCQKRLKAAADDPFADVESTNPTVIKQRPPITPQLRPKCEQLEEMFKRYGVSDIEALYKAINQPLLDSFKVSTMKELEDTLRKVNLKRIALSYLNKEMAFEDYKFYVYNSSKLGWSNVDCFGDVPQENKTALTVNLRPAANIDCKLVFRKRRVIMPGIHQGGQYVFERIPKNEPAFIVAVKYINGVPFLAVKEITTTNSVFDVEFKKLSFEELNAQLMQLDQ